jgi:tripartite-type tricarboxylate transporter receptor subunit TctC
MRRPTVPFGLIMALFGLAVASCPGLARAQDYPAQSIKIIVATPAGGIADLVGRTLAQKRSEAGKTGRRESNRAAGAIAAEAAAKSPPDGYTLFAAMIRPTPFCRTSAPSSRTMPPRISLRSRISPDRLIS